MYFFLLHKIDSSKLYFIRIQDSDVLPCGWILKEQGFLKIKKKSASRQKVLKFPRIRRIQQRVQIISMCGASLRMRNNTLEEYYPPPNNIHIRVIKTSQAHPII